MLNMKLFLQSPMFHPQVSPQFCHCKNKYFFLPTENFLNHLNVGRQPTHLPQLVFGQPLRCLVLVEAHRIGKQRTAVAVHREMEFRVIVLYRAEEGIDTNIGRQFLTNLPFQGPLRGFTGLHLPTGKLPPILPLTVASLRGENPVILAYNGCNHFYLFHIGPRFRLQRYNSAFLVPKGRCKITSISKSLYIAWQAVSSYRCRPTDCIYSRGGKHQTTLPRRSGHRK